MATFPVLQEREGEWTNSKMVEILGLRILSYFAPDPQLLQDFITNFQTKADDVFIASYPKSGEAVELEKCHWLAHPRCVRTCYIYN